MKKLLFISILFIVVSCSNSEIIETQNDDTKQKKSWSFSWSNLSKSWSLSNFSNDFFIETKTIWDFNMITNINKVWKIIPNQNIDIKSQVSWRMSNIYVREWEVVYAGQTIAKISDSYSKYYLELEKAQIDLEKQIINKESQVLSHDQKIENSKVSLNDAKNNYDNAKNTATEDIKKINLDYNNSSLVDEDSQAYLELEKAKLDYENTINKNIQQTESYLQNINKEYNNLNLILNDVIQFSDELLWITDDNEDDNDDFEDYLWAKNTNIKNESEQELIKLINYKKEILLLNISNLNEWNMLEFMDSFYLWYSNISSLLNSIELTLNNSIVSVWTLSENDIDSYISKVNSYQNSNQWNLSSFTSTKNSIASYLNTYKNSELSAFKNVELQEKKLEDSSENWELNYNKSLISIQNTLNSYETKYKQAQLSYDNAIKNREVSIKSLDNLIESATNNKNKAAAEFSKLNIISPINWIISSIDIDNNSDISNWTKLFSVISNNNIQIEVSLNNYQISQVNIWDPVKIEYNWKEFFWEIYSKSSFADDNLDYSVLIVVEDKLDLIWGSTIVHFNINTNNFILPINIVTITWDNMWFINVLENGELKKLEVELWKIDWSFIEINNDFSNNVQIITTDLQNYNKLNQTLKILN